MLGKRVIKIAGDQAGLEADIDSTKESLGMDSLDDVEFVMAIEEVFDIEIPDEDCEKFNCVLDVIHYIYVIHHKCDN